MSPHAANSLIQDLVAMAEATTKLPTIERELEQVRNELGANQEYVLILQQRLMDKANEIDSLKGELAKAKEARDDAEMRFLECDDAKGTLERVLEGLGRDIKGVLEAVRPIPTPTPEPIKVEYEVSFVPRTEPQVEASAASVSTAEGSVSMDPTHAATADQSTSAPSTTEQSAAQTSLVEPPHPFEPTGSATSSSSDAIAGPYVGKFYYETQGYISRGDWIDGGGTNDSYNYRPWNTPRIA